MPTLATLKIELFKLAFATLITYLYLKADFAPKEGVFESLASTMANSAATILGFLITAIALFATIMDRSLLKNLRATGGYQVLIRNSFMCGALYLALLALSVSFLLPWEHHKDKLFTVLIFLGSLSVVHLAAAGYTFYKVIITMSRSGS